MIAEAIKNATDDELRQIISVADTELKERADKRRQEAIGEIRRIAAAQNLSVSIGTQERKKNAKALHAGMRFLNPDNPQQVYEVGKGRPPGWFAKGKGKVMPENDNERIEAVKKVG